MEIERWKLNIENSDDWTNPQSQGYHFPAEFAPHIFYLAQLAV